MKTGLTEDNCLVSLVKEWNGLDRIHSIYFRSQSRGDFRPVTVTVRTALLDRLIGVCRRRCPFVVPPRILASPPHAVQLRQPLR